MTDNIHHSPILLDFFVKLIENVIGNHYFNKFFLFFTSIERNVWFSENPSLQLVGE